MQVKWQTFRWLMAAIPRSVGHRKKYTQFRFVVVSDYHLQPLSVTASLIRNGMAKSPAPA